MVGKNSFGRMTENWHSYPNTFKILVIATFIDTLGGFILFPFFSLYVTIRFSASVTEVGILFSIYSIGSIVGGIVGGALADKYGRRIILLIGLIVSGIGSLIMGLVDSLGLFLIVAVVLGLFGAIGGPARQAMVADLLPIEKQAEGFGVLRVAFNLSATIGPLLGGLFITISYMILFIIDAISSIAMFFIVYFVIPETKPEKKDNELEESIGMTIVGYKEVLKDGVYVTFCLINMLTVIVYLQMNATLSIFLYEVHGFPEQGFGWLLSMNALIVVLFQFRTAKIVSKRDPMKMMALGALFYMIGFGMFAFIGEIYLFIIAMIIITIGEMIVSPVSQAAVAYFAPEDKRGRYMAIFGFTWTIPNTFGIILAGLIMDNIGPHWLWYCAGLLSLLAAFGFWFIRKIAKERLDKNKQEVDIVGR